MHISFFAFFSPLFLYAILAPFNKVEESFSTQAVYDLMAWNPAGQLKEFDHILFPGIVPRTFIAPILLAPTTFLMGTLVQWMKLDLFWPHHQTRLAYLLGLRISIAFFMALSLSFVASKLPRGFLLINIAQFHLMFWGSRAIANVFALILFNFALGLYLDILRGRSRLDSMICTLSACCILFRAEVFPMASLMICHSYYLHRKEYSFLRMIYIGSLSSLIFIAVTVSIDSYFWQRFLIECLYSRLLWPEFEVFIFNGVEGKSADWGTSPWYYYVTNLVPKISSFSILVTLGSAFLQKPLTIRKEGQSISIWPFLALSVLHLSCLSLIYHKEWRFVIYLVPLLSIAASLSVPTNPSIKGANAVFSILWMAYFSISLLFLYISRLNYPGGDALIEFSSLIHQPKFIFPHENCWVHLDVYTAMTGASRFLQSSSCVYSKDENHATIDDYLKYNWIITSTPSNFSSKYQTILSFNGYDRVTLENPFDWIDGMQAVLWQGDWVLFRLPLTILTSPKVFILRRLQN
jgi:alpha-1,6-mannosyltransferase